MNRAFEPSASSWPSSSSSIKTDYDFCTSPLLQVVVPRDEAIILPPPSQTPMYIPHYWQEQEKKKKEKKSLSDDTASEPPKQVARQNWSGRNGNYSHYSRLQWNCPYEPTCTVHFASTEARNAHLWHIHRCHPYRCYLSGCNSSFASKREVGNHRKIAHANATSYSCFKCSKVYFNYRSLIDHVNTIHLSGLFRCSYANCAQICTTRNQKDHHQQTHLAVPSSVHIVESHQKTYLPI